MKKLIAVSILFTFLATAAFAQFRAGLILDFFPELINTKSFSGDWGNQGHPVAANFRGQGYLDFFNTSGQFNFNRLYLDLHWLSPEGHWAAHARVDGRAFVNNWGPIAGFGGSSDNYAAGGDAMLSPNTGREMRLANFLTAPLEDWWFRGRIGMFEAQLGNIAHRGATNHARFLGTGSAIEFNWIWEYTMWGFGFVLPFDGRANPQAEAARAGFAETNDLRVFPNVWNHYVPTIPGGPLDPAYNPGMFAMAARPYFRASGDFGMIRVDLAGVMSDLDNIMGTPLDEYGYRRVGAAVRVSGIDIADMVTIDVVYRLSGGDPDIKEHDIYVQPDGTGVWVHNAGVFAAFNLFDMLGIGFGYSIMLTSFEDFYDGMSPLPDGQTIRRAPVLHGVDLRLNAHVTDELTITFNNNITFSTFRGVESADTYNIWLVNPVVPGIDLTHPDVQGDRASDMRMSYIGIFNQLGFRFALAPNFAFHALFQNTHRRSRIVDETEVTGAGEATYTRVDNRFITQVFGQYTLGTNVTMGAGLAMHFLSHSTSVTNGGINNRDHGWFTFSVPLRLRIAF